MDKGDQDNRLYKQRSPGLFGNRIENAQLY